MYSQPISHIVTPWKNEANIQAHNRIQFHRIQMLYKMLCLLLGRFQLTRLLRYHKKAMKGIGLSSSELRRLYPSPQDINLFDGRLAKYSKARLSLRIGSYMSGVEILQEICIKSCQPVR
jgi:hypothetical protein